MTSRHIKNGTVKPADLRNRAVTTKKLRDGSVTAAKLANGAVLTTKIADGAVGGADLANGSVNGAKVADGSITGPDIANGTMSAAKLDPATVGDVRSAAGTLPSTGAQTDVLTVDGFGVLRAQCSPPSTLGFFYALNSPVSQTAREFANDPTDNMPQGGTALSGTGGGLGYSAANHALLYGEIWTFTAERVLWMEIRIDPGCRYRVRATLDRNDAP